MTQYRRLAAQYVAGRKRDGNETIHRLMKRTASNEYTIIIIRRGLLLASRWWLLSTERVYLGVRGFAGVTSR